MAKIGFDGFNLSLEKGTGVATYSRVLTQVAKALGHEVTVTFASRSNLPKDPALREINFFDAPESVRSAGRLSGIIDYLKCYRGIRTVPIPLSGLVVTRQFASRMPAFDRLDVARNMFSATRPYFYLHNAFAEIRQDHPPDLFHWTYQLPLRARGATNVYTIHDLVPLRLPFATLDRKRYIYRLLVKIARTADHIITVSEHSRQDIIKLLGVSEDRVTNTYQAVDFPPAAVARMPDQVAQLLEGTFGLESGKYLLFYGAMEPKKNLKRLIEAYLGSGVKLPLVVVSGGGWQNDSEVSMLADNRDARYLSFIDPHGSLKRPGGLLRQIEYVQITTLVSLIRGARAVLFPSLYEGFGLPVLEAMQLGTPVVTSTESSLPEIAGDAALLVDPYRVDDIAKAIVAIASDDDLHADLVRRGTERAAFFSVAQYRDRMASLYQRLL